MAKQEPLQLPPPPIDEYIQQDHNRKAIYSFGDDGVTASASPCGRLLQMTRHFVDEKHGFCVDHPLRAEPFFVEARLGALLFSPSEAVENGGIGPAFDLSSLGGKKPPCLSYVNDRWPLFSTTAGVDGGGEIRARMHYVVSRNTVYQTYEFDFGPVESRDRRGGLALPRLSVMSNVLITNLDFVNSKNEFNEAHDDDPEYYDRISDNSQCIVRVHNAKLEDESKNAVALFICPFSENQPLTFANRGGSEHDIRWNDDAMDQLKKEGKLVVTIAYTLQLVSQAPLSTDSPVTLRDLHHARQQLLPVGRLTFVEDQDLDFKLRRNLQHILSVCSIPVTRKDRNGIAAVALTCGDADGHRVANAASFYSFQYLLLALKHLNGMSRDCQCPPFPVETCGSSVCSMQARIMRVCKGHLKWVFQTANRPNRLFSPHYWPSGEDIANWEKNDCLDERALVDTPFHIIKAGDFFDLVKDVEFQKSLDSDIELAVQAWIEHLDKRNQLGLYAFPRHRKESTHNFYLSDHALIWRAIKSVEPLNLSSKVYKPVGIDSRCESTARGSDKAYRKPRIYSSSQIQNNILKRFTTENPASKTRMLAVSRSPAQSRFLLRTKDGALFHVMDLGLFDKPGTATDAKASGETRWENKVNIWRNTVDCQMLHEDNDDTAWEESLRFALSIMMASNGKRMNSRPVAEMRKHAMSVLCNSASPDGLFPGQLDENGEAVMYDNELRRDTYWGVTFEIPYILWKFDSRCPKSSAPSRAMSADSDGKMALPREDADVLKSLTKLLEQHMGVKDFANPVVGHSMKRTFPFNDAFDRQNIVERSDEWLYNEPAFFAPVDPFTLSDISVAGASASQMTLGNDMASMLEPHEPQRDVLGAVLDIPKSKKMKGNLPSLREMMTQVNTNEALVRLMIQGRCQAKSKKRMCFFFSADALTNEILCRASSEREELLAFFKRHVSCDKFFFEDTAAVLNKWVTELHLSFYAIDRREFDDKAKPDMSNVEAQPLSLPGSDGKSTRITRVAMSFRFDGDLFDRYWTCHYFERDAQTKTNRLTLLQDIQALLQGTQPSDAEKKLAPWRQRRVLELLLFGRMVLQMNTRADEILNEAKSKVWAIARAEHGKTTQDAKPLTDAADHSVQDAFDEIHYHAFLITSKRCQRFQHVLQTVQADLAANLAKMSVWLNRERERQAERPRWTDNDEIRYRGIVSKLLVVNDHSLQDLRRSHGDISTFNESLMKKLDLMRGDLDQRRADDIQRFTNVTVVFLPVGFATGVFSTSQTPGATTLIRLVATAVVALAITVLALNFKALKKKTPKWLFAAWLWCCCCCGRRRGRSDSGVARSRVRSPAHVLPVHMPSFHVSLHGQDGSETGKYKQNGHAHHGVRGRKLFGSTRGERRVGTDPGGRPNGN